MGFPDGSMVKNLPPNAGDMLSIPKSEKSLVKETAASSSILSRKSHVQRIRGAEGRALGSHKPRPWARPAEDAELGTAAP